MLYRALQNLRMGDLGRAEWYRVELYKALAHVEFCVKLYKGQLRLGYDFLHEHPATATSWTVPSIERLGESAVVKTIVAHVCAFGVKAADEPGEGPVNTGDAIHAKSHA